MTTMQERENLSLQQDIEDMLNEIDHILHQMLLLAELSASDSIMDRESLQKVSEHLQAKIDWIADKINDMQGSPTA